MPKDLQKDKKQFCLYTIKWAKSIETLVENHCSELMSLLEYLDEPEKFKQIWKETIFCKGCLVAHSVELMGYASEAVTGGGCGAPEAWGKLQETASELHDYLLPLNEAKDYTKDVKNKVEEFNTNLRVARKKIEDAEIEFATLDEKDNVEHIS